VIDQHLTIRAATAHDRDALSRLARRRFTGPADHALLAERDGVAIAAIALSSGRIATNTRLDSANAVRRLRHRRYQLLRQGGDAGPAWSLLRRLAPQLAAS